MTSNILNIEQVGQNVVVSFSLTDDSGNIMTFDSTNFQGTPCINMTFPIPLTATAITDLESNINTAISNRLNTEFVNLYSQTTIATIISQVQTDLSGTQQTLTSFQTGGTVLTPQGLQGIGQIASTSGTITVTTGSLT